MPSNAAFAIEARRLAERADVLRVEPSANYVAIPTLASMISELAGLVAATLERIDSHSRNSAPVAHGSREEI